MKYNIEKSILRNYSDIDFKRLINTIMVFGNYSFFNSLLVDYQCPYFLDLYTKNEYERLGFKVLDNATNIKILSNNEDKIIELFDCKETTMGRDNYKEYDLPKLFYCESNEIYDSFVKAIYTDGYKISYCDNIDSKFNFEKENKLINIRRVLTDTIKIKCIIAVYSSDITNDFFEQRLIAYAINKELGFEDDFLENNSLTKWFNNNKIENVEKTFDIMTSKARKLIDNFNRFYNLELKKNKGNIDTIDNEKSIYY